MTSSANWILVWAEWMLRASLQAGVLCAILLAAGPFLRRIPATLRHALWMLVPVKALLPPALSSPIALVAPAVQPAENYCLTVLRLFADPIRGQHGALGVGPDVGVLSTPLPETGTMPIVPAAAALLTGLFAMWVVGVLRMLWLMAAQHRQVSRIIAQGRLVDRGPLAELLERVAGPGRTRPRLILADTDGSPFLCGILNPTIVLPAGLPGSLTPEELAAVLRHELEHWRRGDLLWCWIESVALALFWFHPLVWLAQDRITEVRELAVDAAVSGATLSDRVAYARTILTVLEETVAAPARAVAFTGGPGVRVERRIREAINPVRVGPVETRALWAGAVVFAAVMLPMNSSWDDLAKEANRAVAVQEAPAA